MALSGRGFKSLQLHKPPLFLRNGSEGVFFGSWLLVYCLNYDSFDLCEDYDFFFMSIIIIILILIIVYLEDLT